MGSLKLCDGDPVVERLRSMFGANIVRIPRASLRPLEVLASRKGYTRTMGQLGDILSGAPPFALDPGDLHEEPAPAVLATKTSSVAFNLGLDILGGLLQGFGLSKAGLGAAFTHTSAISFTFRDVRHVYVEVNRLGRALQNRAVDRDNPAAAPYFAMPDPWRLLLVDSVLTSPGFTVTASRSATESGHIDVPALEQLAANAAATVKLSSSASSEVSFTGEKPLTFAFTCLAVALDVGARIVQLTGDTQRVVIQGLPGAGELGDIPPRLNGVLLSDDPAMLDLEDGTGQ